MAIYKRGRGDETRDCHVTSAGRELNPGCRIPKKDRKHGSFILVTWIYNNKKEILEKLITINNALPNKKLELISNLTLL